eukprot:2737913-Ditylum_brightwellii.AAC.1
MLNNGHTFGNCISAKEFIEQQPKLQLRQNFSPATFEEKCLQHIAIGIGIQVVQNKKTVKLFDKL